MPESMRVVLRLKSVGSEPTRDPRRAFWSPRLAASDAPIENLEAQLKSKLGVALANNLVTYVRRPIEEVARAFWEGQPEPMRELRFWLREPPWRGELGPYSFLDAYGRLTEAYIGSLRESPAVTAARERVAAASRVVFAVRIAGYASLTLDIIPSPLRELARAFDGDFESLQVFLEAFIAPAFAEVFDEHLAAHYDFSVQVPSSIQAAFGRSPEPPVTPFTPLPASSSPSPGSGARERAEFLWRLANGSLLIPFLIALLVMYFGFKELGRMRELQLQSLQPILQHQLELLREDRLRLSPMRDSATPQTPTRRQ